VSRLKEHHDGLIAFPDRPAPLTRPEPAGTDDNGAPTWEVQRILDHRKQRKRNQYLVLWKGYPLSEATWEPIEHLNGALELLLKYNQKNNIALNVVTTLQHHPSQAESWSKLAQRGSTSPTRGG
jgi:hypothetical protein